jgi:hypothetical protein
VLNRLHVLNRLPCPSRPAAAIPTRDHCSHEIASGKTDPEDGGDAQAKSDKQRTHNGRPLIACGLAADQQPTARCRRTPPPDPRRPAESGPGCTCASIGARELCRP